MTEFTSTMFKPIGHVRTRAEKVPRHWSISDVEGTLEIDGQYEKGLKDINAGQKIIVIFEFHESPVFEAALLIQRPGHIDKDMGVFSICSPRRPNPIGYSVVEVIERKGANILVKGIDMLNDTPILDIKPHVADNG